MSKSHLSWLAVALVLGGMAVLTGHPAWGTVTGGVLILLAAASAGAARIRSERKGDGPRGQRVPNNLVTLSAAAILAVYATGFNRTRAAADAFAAQAARRRAPAPIAASVEPAKAAQPAAQAPPAVEAVAPSPVSRVPVPVTASKKDRAPDSSIRVRSKAPAPAKAPKPELTASLSAPPPMPPDAAPAGPNAAPAAPPAATPTTPAESLAGQTAAVPAAPKAPATPAPVAPKAHYRDGTYYGWGRSAHGDIRASVVIQGGRIALTGIDKCNTAYSCSWIAALPGQVVTRQIPTIDCVSGASDSSYAFQDAITAALFRAQGG